MKKCEVCGEDFDDKYAFCPLDGMPLPISFLPGEGPGLRGNRPRRQAVSSNLSQREREFDQEVAAFEPREFNLTLIGDAHLSRRLAMEIQFVVDQIKRAWPSFKSDPVAFARTEFGELRKRVNQTLARPHVVLGATTAVLVLSALILSVLFLERLAPKRANKNESDELTLVTIDFRQVSTPNADKGVGVGDKGRVGIDSGRGEGSAPKPARSQGGGGSGNRDPNPSSQGSVPQPSVIPAPISTTYAQLPRSLPDAGIEIDPVLWKDLRYPNYGDPRSKSTTPSNGSGEGGSVGTGKGTGIGEGEDNGFGPGRKGNIGGNDNSPGCCGKGGSSGNNPNPNDPDRVYNPSEVTRARVLFKPEPQYTEQARKDNITGTVILRVVFSRTGEVTNIRAMQSLQGGLTEKAIAAARQIRFVPATRNGQPVSMYMQLEYNFNLY
jgi:TonB family protein